MKWFSVKYYLTLKFYTRNPLLLKFCKKQYNVLCARPRDLSSITICWQLVLFYILVACDMRQATFLIISPSSRK